MRKIIVLSDGETWQALPEPGKDVPVLVLEISDDEFAELETGMDVKSVLDKRSAPFDVVQLDSRGGVQAVLERWSP